MAIRPRRMYSIPAFLAALVSGAIVVGLYIGIAISFQSQEYDAILGLPLTFILFSPFMAPAVGAMFFPVFFVARRTNRVNARVLTISGLVGGIILASYFYFSKDIVFGNSPLAFMLGGAVGGYVAFLTLKILSERNEANT